MKPFLAKTTVENVASQISGSNTLFVIGNGFDIAHGVKSSYYDFSKTIGRNSPLRSSLEFFLDCENLWGDFEGNLAKLDRERLMMSVEIMLDDVEVSDPEDDDFSLAEYYSSIEMGLEPIHEILYELPKRFRKWVNGLTVASGNKDSLTKLFNSPDNRHFLNFNYTDFLETLYGVPRSGINYIHGCRKDKKTNLVLGHGENPDANLDEWRERNENRFRVHEHRRRPVKRKNGRIVYVQRYESMTELAYFNPEPEKGNWKTPIHYYAFEQAVGMIEEYFEDSQKKTDEIIDNNASWFSSVSGVNNIVVLGHSLMPVDYPYFEKLVDSCGSRTNWHVSWYSDADLDRISSFAGEMNIHQIDVFQI